MSQNDIIYLVKVGKRYAIIHADAESESQYKKVWAKTAEEALVKAEAMQDETGAKYGVMISVMTTPKEL